LNWDRIGKETVVSIIIPGKICTESVVLKGNSLEIIKYRKFEEI